MRLYFEQIWSSVTRTGKLCSREIQLKKSVSITKLAISVELNEKILQSNRKLQFFLIHRILPKFSVNITDVNFSECGVYI